MPLPDFSPLPVWAQVIGYGTLAVCLAVMAAVTLWGILHGKKAPTASGGAATVAAVIVDSNALDRATGEIAGLNIELAKVSAVGERLISSNAEISKSVGDLGESIDKLRDEVIRSAAQMRK